MDSVGIRELKQNASAVLRRVQAGETLEITDRGRPVARIVPLKKMSVLDRLIAEGRATPAQDTFEENMRKYPMLPPYKPGEKTLSEILAEMRANER